MSLLPRTTRLLRPTILSPITTTTSRFASSNQQPAQNVEGASGKDTNKAQPKILSDSPPLNESEQSEEVKRHNEEMSRRAERAGAQVSKEDVENDKVGKGFWSGDKTKGGTAGGSS